MRETTDAAPEQGEMDGDDMEVELELDADVYAFLANKAEALGVSVNDLINTILREEFVRLEGR